ncbi:MAG TPA: hypothetical protein VFC19_48995 [Candidatus Limnocylindrales bacterium]|nr:hypothetical protein [Candidatus Limnocylindrales bacterium]
MKSALAMVLLLGVIAIPGAVRAGGCDRVEPVFGMKALGLLVEHDYCVEGQGGRFLSSKVVATFDNGSVPRLFWGGRLPGNLSVIYAVTAGGRLRWGRQLADGALGPMVEVGHQFGDWSRYTALFSTGMGELFGVDERGRLLRWQHAGWRDGDDVWAAGPRDVGPACKPGPMVFAAIKGPTSSVLVPPTNPPGYAFCTWDGRVEWASTLPAGLVSPTAAPAPSVTFALREGDSRLVRLRLEIGRPVAPMWIVDDTADASYLNVFTGNSFKPGSDDDLFKYEWQWAFYDGKYYELT